MNYGQLVNSKLLSAVVTPLKFDPIVEVSGGFMTRLVPRKK